MPPTPFYKRRAGNDDRKRIRKTRCPQWGSRRRQSIFRRLAAHHLPLFATIVCTDKTPVYTVTASTKAHLITLYSASVSRFKIKRCHGEATENAKNTRKNRDEHHRCSKPNGICRCKRQRAVGQCCHGVPAVKKQPRIHGHRGKQKNGSSIRHARPAPKSEAIGESSVTAAHSASIETA